ncbi:MAG: type II 3-dehydroquinate dehydratase [Pseudomonadota bacterium]
MTSILVLNGPNLNLLGTRQPDVYGSATLTDVEELCRAEALALTIDLAFEQTNHEGALVEEIHSARGVHDGLIINAGAYTHTSIAIMDAVLSCEIPTVEVHLSNTHAREDFRHTSYLSKAALGSIQGFGPASYTLAIRALHGHLSE